MKDKKKLIIIIAIAVLVIAGIIVAVIFIPKKNKPTDKTTTTTTAAIADEITIKFDTKDGEKIEDMKVKKGEKVTLPAANKEGYTFDNWVDDKDNVYNSESTFESDITLIAKYTEIKKDTKTAKITFDSKGGSKVSASTLECVEDTITVKLPKNPTKDGFKFRAWEDKNGKAILTGAKLTCENITLYAAWDKVESKPEPTPTPEPTPEPTKEKKLTCPDGFTLNESTKKCTSQKSPEYYCETGKESNGTGSKVCYSWASNPTSTTCKNGGTYITREHSSALCGYEIVSRLDGNETGCRTEVNGQYYNNHCYKRIELATESILDHSCPGTSAYRTSAELGNTANSGCYNLSQRTYGCKNAGEGYSMNYSIGKCVKTIDAELK